MSAPRISDVSLINVPVPIKMPWSINTVLPIKSWSSISERKLEQNL